MIFKHLYVLIFSAKEASALEGFRTNLMWMPVSMGGWFEINDGIKGRCGKQGNQITRRDMT